MIKCVSQAFEKTRIIQSSLGASLYSRLVQLFLRMNCLLYTVQENCKSKFNLIMIQNEFTLQFLRKHNIFC